ncbi:uL15 family ribosomal protein [Candidatus Micrarchaeota archaeon]|nr:uL15 family ribosomal protein [Candidatus Micrarchaeota archaeon]
MKRKQGQKKGYLGHRSHGRGNVKNRRGSGNRGGHGMAGIDKHKWSWAMKNDPGYFGRSVIGFVRPNKTVRMPVVHLYQINQQAMLNKVEHKGGKYHFDFKGKILATGDVTLPLHIKAMAWSKNVEKKLKSVGGEISKLEISKPK